MSRAAKTARSAAIALALGGGAAVWLYVSQVSQREAHYEAAEEEKRLFDFGRAHVRGGVLRTRGATIAFSRAADGDDGFRLTSPIDSAADTDAMTALLNRAAVVRAERVISTSPSPSELRDWGLSPAVARLDLELDPDHEGGHVGLLVGKKNPIVGGIYIKRADAPEVALADPSFYWAFDRELSDYRSKHLVPFAAEDVVRAEIVTSTRAGNLTLVRDETGFTVTSSKVSASGDAGRVMTLLRPLTDRLLATRFITDDYAEDGGYGLDAPLAEVTLTPEDGGPIRLLFSTPPGEPLIAHVEGTGTVAAVDPTLLKVFGLGLVGVRERILARFEPDEAQVIELRLGGDILRFERDDEAGWIAPERSSLKVKTWRLDAITRALAYLDGSVIYRFEPSADELSEWGLTPSQARLRAFDAEGESLADVHLGYAIDEEHLFAKSASEPRVMAVEKGRLSALPERPTDLLE